MKSSFQCSPLTWRRTPLSLAEAYRFAENGKVPIKSRGLNRQVADQIAYFLSVYRPVPRLYFPMSARCFSKKAAATFAFRLTRAFSREGTIFFASYVSPGLAAEGACAALIMCSIPRPSFRRTGPISLA